MDCLSKNGNFKSAPEFGLGACKKLSTNVFYILSNIDGRFENKRKIRGNIVTITVISVLER